jgi:hypothetical protein
MVADTLAPVKATPDTLPHLAGHSADLDQVRLKRRPGTLTADRFFQLNRHARQRLLQALNLLIGKRTPVRI